MVIDEAEIKKAHIGTANVKEMNINKINVDNLSSTQRSSDNVSSPLQAQRPVKIDNAVPIIEPSISSLQADTKDLLVGNEKQQIMDNALESANNLIAELSNTTNIQQNVAVDQSQNSKQVPSNAQYQSSQPDNVKD